MYVSQREIDGFKFINVIFLAVSAHRKGALMVLVCTKCFHDFFSFKVSFVKSRKVIEFHDLISALLNRYFEKNLMHHHSQKLTQFSGRTQLILQVPILEFFISFCFKQQYEDYYLYQELNIYGWIEKSKTTDTREKPCMVKVVQDKINCNVFHL